MHYTPYSILIVDELMGSVLAARSRSQGFSTNQDLLASQIAHYREAAKQVQEKERQAVDELEHAQLWDFMAQRVRVTHVAYKKKLRHG